MTFTPYLKALPKNQRRTWPHLAPAKEFGFCLYGGTAIALRFGHRQSVDFDFFCSESLNKSRLVKHLPLLTGAEVIQEDPDTYVVLAAPPGGGKNARVRVAFFGGLSFGRVGIPELTADGVLVAASLRDLMATKLKVLFDRVEVKDYLDIAEMLERGVSLSQAMGDAKALFSNFNPIICLKSLCYFDLPQLSSLDKKRRSILVKAVKEASAAKPSWAASSVVSSSLALPSGDLEAAHARDQRDA